MALVSGFDDNQHSAVMSQANLLCVLAGAGSGKTAVLTHRVARRIADGSAGSRHTLVLTFTRKAADELRDRLKRLDVDNDITTGTFHSVAYAQLRRRWLDQGKYVPAVVSNPIRMLDSVLKAMRFGKTISPQSAASEIAWAKSRFITSDVYEEEIFKVGRKTSIPVAQLQRVYEAYESEKRKRRMVDYDDLLLLMAQAMNQDKSFAETQRWLFRHIYVDEFQDLNRAQFQLLERWIGANEDLFIVGDPNQAIYAWNGADPSYLLEVDSYFPGIEKIRLDTNYRSTAHVLTAASAVLPNVGAVLPDGAISDTAAEVGLPPVIKSCFDERDEALSVAKFLRSAHSRAHRWSDMAVLVRTNIQRAEIEKALGEFKIPYQSLNGTSWLSHSEVRVVIDYLQESPSHKLGERLSDIDQMAQDAAGSGRSYLMELLGLARQAVQNDPEIVITDFLSSIEVASKQDGPFVDRRAGGVVTITTFHRSKGLEWPVVCLAGLEEGFVPYGNASGDQFKEEQRLFYVAVTRAKRELYCSWSEQRTSSKGKLIDRKPSPWLIAIEKAARNVVDESSTQQVARTSLDTTRDILSLEVVDAPSEEIELRESVNKWRSARARLTGADPQLILADEVIDEIVRLLPESRETLGSIEGFGKVRAASIGDEILVLVNGVGKTTDVS